MANRKKVLWLIKGLGAGGAEKLLSMSLPYLDRDAFDYRIVYLTKGKTDLVPDFERHGIPIFCLDMKNVYDLRVFFRLYRLLREMKVDILHIHSPHAAIIGRLAGRLAGVKAIISTEHELFEKLPVPIKLGSLITYPLNDATIGVSQAVVRSVSKCRTARPETLHAIHNAIDVGNIDSGNIDPASIKLSLGIDPRNLVVGNVAHIRNPQKGHPYLIEAAKLVIEQWPEVNFVIVGRGTDAAISELERQAERLGIRDKVIFTGFRLDAVQLMAAFDIFVLPSLWEAFGIVLLEAMAQKKPVVASRSGGIPEVIDDGVNGFLVEPGNPRQLADRIVALLKDRPLRERMGNKGMQKVYEKFTISYMVREIERVYASVLNGKCQRPENPLLSTTGASEGKEQSL